LHNDHPGPPTASPHWSPRPRVHARLLPAGLANWLFDRGSLTQRLREICADRFRVRVLRQEWTRPDHDEAHALQLRMTTWAWVREVQLLCGDQPWVFARTLIPALTLGGRGRQLTRLGSRPLGEVLFADPTVRRGPVEVARIGPDQRLHHRAFANCNEPPDTIWARRSLFWMDSSPLLVCEIFLPDLPVSPACR